MNNKTLFFLFIFVFSVFVWGQTNSPAFLPFQALITDNSDNIQASLPVTMVIQITNTTGCVLYQETQLATTDSKGLVSLAVGQGSSPSYATGTGGIFKNVFRNNSTFISACVGGGSATLTPTEGRKIQFNVNGGGMSPGIDIGSLGFAYFAEHAVDSDNLAGFPASSYLDVNGVSSMAAALKLNSWAAAPSGTQAGQLGYNNGSGKLEYYNGGSWVQVPTSGTGITSLGGLGAASQTFTNDTNITITSAGSTHTLGFSGQLSLARGGTNSNLTANNGAVCYSGATSLQLSAVGTAGQFLMSNGAAAPTWATPSSTDSTKLPLAGGTMTGNIDLGSNKITSLADGSAAQEAAAFGQIGTAITANNANYVKKDGTTALTADWDINGATAGGTIKITGLADPTVSDGAATKNYVDAADSSKVSKAGDNMSGTLIGRVSTASAGTAPIKLPTGVLMTTPEAGAIEYDGTNLYFTDNSTTRKTISTGGGGGFLNGGNSFSSSASLGTNDAYSLNLKTNGLTRLLISSFGNGIYSGPQFSVNPTAGTAATNALNVTYTHNNTSSFDNFNSNLTLNPSVPYSGNYSAGYFNLFMNSNSSQSGGYASGLTSNILASGTGPRNYVDGADIYVQQNSGTSTTMNGVESIIDNSGGTISDAAAISVGVFESGGGSNSIGYGIYIDQVNATNPYSIYASDSLAPSYFAGNVGIGTNTPLATLDVNGSVNTNGSLNVNGHISNNQAGTPSATCGTVTGNDTRGIVTFSGPVSGCTITFANSFATAPYCVITPVQNISVTYWINIASTTDFTINLSAPSTPKFNYICMQ